MWNQTKPNGNPSLVDMLKSRRDLFVEISRKKPGYVEGYAEGLQEAIIAIEIQEQEARAAEAESSGK